MKRKRLSLFVIGILSVSFLLSFWFSLESNNEMTSQVKIALRETGHNLLLTNKDSTSLVMPIEELSERKYKLAFESQLEILPDSLVAFVKRSLTNSGIEKGYLVEVLQCQSEAVTYSYQIKNNFDTDIIHCADRVLPRSCYEIFVAFDAKESSSKSYLTIIRLVLLVAILGLLVMLFKRRSFNYAAHALDNNYITLGSFKFLPEQNKLIKEAVEIGLSKKECEILSIFVAKPNQVIKRDELSKKVWEDNGVVVGRSLDTYISKLRKKLSEDNKIKLSNVHGVGYKLEIYN